MNIQKRNNIISLVLILVILALSYVLYDSIVTPWQTQVAKQKVTDSVRLRMTLVRDALVAYQAKDKNGKFPTSLDSLVNFLKTDSLMLAKGATLYAEPGREYFPDSLIFSPRPPHSRFEYSVNDTIRPPLYQLKDPNSDDVIGDLVKITLLNAPSWK